MYITINVIKNDYIGKIFVVDINNKMVNVSECSICFEKLSGEEGKIFACVHVYCLNCSGRLSRKVHLTNCVCPLCRAEPRWAFSSRYYREIQVRITTMSADKHNYTNLNTIRHALPGSVSHLFYNTPEHHNSYAVRTLQLWAIMCLVSKVINDSGHGGKFPKHCGELWVELKELAAYVIKEMEMSADEESWSWLPNPCFYSLFTHPKLLQQIFQSEAVVTRIQGESPKLPYRFAQVFNG